MRVLVVDDELVSRKKMRKILLNYGPCDAVDSGSNAVAVAARAREEGRPYDLICLDIAMPDLKGTDVLAKLRDLETRAGIPRDRQTKILMVTAHADQETITESIRAGCDDYVIKPFSSSTVLKKLKNIGLI